MDETAGIARHLHVPMQAGSDTVLRAMRRHYSIATFLARMRRARERLPGVNLTSDVIVGHPAERPQDFAATLEAVRAAGFTKVHVFPYSPRPGTADAQDDPVPAAEKRRRSRELRRLSDEQGAAHRAAKVGSRELVLVEDAAGRGYSDDYTPFRVSGGESGLIVPARGVDAGSDAVIATLCA
jgi:threonylcarbamoyladenosine tRNA methylthiotransferase MtaB